MEKTASAEHITLDELVRDAVERRLNKHELDEVFAFGKRNANDRGLRPRDVAAAIADVRSEDSRADSRCFQSSPTPTSIFQRSNSAERRSGF